MPPISFWKEDVQLLLCRLYQLPDKIGVSKGEAPFGTRLCDAKCSVLYLLSRLAGKMRVSPNGNAHFARQENGQFFANGNEKKLGDFGSGSGDIQVSYPSQLS